MFSGESEATAICLSARKRSSSGNKAEEAARRSPAGSLALRDSDKCFICAKAKRQQQSE